MKTHMHSKFYGFLFATAFLLIVAVFGAVFYFLATFNGVFDMRNVILLIGGVVGALALLTGAFYCVARLDNQIASNDHSEKADDDDAVSYRAVLRDLRL